MKNLRNNIYNLRRAFQWHAAADTHNHQHVWDGLVRLRGITIANYTITNRYA